MLKACPDFRVSNLLKEVIIWSLQQLITSARQSYEY